MSRRIFFNIIVFVIVITSLSFGGYFYYQYRNLENNASINNNNQKETQDLLSKVAQLYLIPTGEDPTIATVSDPSVLKDQLFFSSSLKGDKVLIFNKAGKAVLYRPSINKIIEIAPINTNDQSIQTPLQTTTTTPGPLKNKSF